MPTEFEKNLAWGEEGENIVARFLAKRGCMVSPLAQGKHDKAPVLVLSENDAFRRLIHPDLTVFRSDGQVLFAEVKRKRQWVGPYDQYRPGRGRETGFDAYQLPHYAGVSDRSKLPIWLFFVHERQPPTGIYAQALDVMTPHIRPWDGRDERTGELRHPSPMVLFPESCLIRLWDLAEVDPRTDPLAGPITITAPARKPEPQGGLF